MTLNCPFCGATPHQGAMIRTGFQDGEAQQNYRVWCPHGCASFDEPSKALAIAAWNQRAPLAALPTGDLVERLKKHVAQFEADLTEDMDAAVQSGERPDLWTREIDVPVDLLSEAAARIQALEAERDEARQLVAEANNSLYGSQGYFHSMNGGAFDKYHLAKGIEDLKSRVRALARAALNPEEGESTDRVQQAYKAGFDFAMLTKDEAPK